MSWTDYISNLEAGNGKCKYAVLCGRKGGVWAESTSKEEFCLTAEELTKLTQIITSGNSDIYGNGVLLHGIKFTCLRLEEEVVVLQGKEDFKDYSLVAAISGQALIVGFNPDSSVKAANVRDGVEGIKEYLKTLGY